MKRASVSYDIISSSLQTYNWNPRRKGECSINTKKTITRHIIVMLIKTSDKEKYLKITQKKQKRCITRRDK